MRDELGPLLDAARDHIAAVRITVRRGDLADAAEVAAPLPSTPPSSRRSSRHTGEQPTMKKLLGVFLGVLSAIGGFVDIGDLVANAADRRPLPA